MQTRWVFHRYQWRNDHFKRRKRNGDPFFLFPRLNKYIWYAFVPKAWQWRTVWAQTALRRVTQMCLSLWLILLSPELVFQLQVLSDIWKVFGKKDYIITTTLTEFCYSDIVIPSLTLNMWCQSTRYKMIHSKEYLQQHLFTLSSSSSFIQTSFMASATNRIQIISFSTRVLLNSPLLFSGWRPRWPFYHRGVTSWRTGRKHIL